MQVIDNELDYNDELINEREQGALHNIYFILCKTDTLESKTLRTLPATSRLSTTFSMTFASS